MLAVMPMMGLVVGTVTPVSMHRWAADSQASWRM